MHTALPDSITRLLDPMPRREARTLSSDPYAERLLTLLEHLDEGETVASVTCAVSARLGRGVIVLTSHRLLFQGMNEFVAHDLADIEHVTCRPAKFTMACAMHLWVGGKKTSMTVGAGRRWGPTFVEQVQRSLPASAAA